MSNEPTNKETKQKPAKQFRAGAISVAIFKRDHNGETFYNATPSRAYTKDNGSTWVILTTLIKSDLPVISRLLDMAFAWIVSQS